VNSLLLGLRAAAESTRLRILGLTADGELTASELVQILGQSQPRVSRHLKLLCEAGLLERHREGAWAMYRLAEQGEAGRLARQLVDLMPAEDVQAALDRHRLAAIKQARAQAAAEYFRANANRWAEIRSLYVPEAEVERAMLDLVGDKPIEQLLDIGTGTGRMLEIFASRVRHGLGIDLSHDMLRVARSRLTDRGLRNCQVRHGDMYNLALPNACCDLVLLHQVLRYAEEPRWALAEAARLLRPGGRLLAVDFSPHELDYLRGEHRHRWLGFAAADMERWLAAVGLRPAVTRHLAGDPLTVSIWLAGRGVQPPPTRPAAVEGAVL